jgi:DNA-binding transcriptional LysR family regulator
MKTLPGSRVPWRSADLTGSRRPLLTTTLAGDVVLGKLIFDMRNITDMNLAGVDLNLLVVFDAVTSEGSVTRAGTRLGMSQPAVSNALARLRHLLKDDLFVRENGSMRPTPRALELTGPVRNALRQIEGVFDPSDFDPVRDARVFKFAMSDHAAVTVLPELVRRLEIMAPNVNLHVRPKSNLTVANLLDTHEIDFALGVMPDPPPLRFSRTTLFEDVMVCVMRRGHALAKGEITLARYASATHLAVRPAGEKTNLVDHVLERQGLKRRRAVTVNQFLVVPAVVSKTNLVSTLFQRTAEQLGILENPDLVTRPLPWERVQATLFWNSTMTQHKAHRWMRSVLIDCCRPLA